MTRLLAPPPIAIEPARKVPLVIEAVVAHVQVLPVRDMVPCRTCGWPCLKEYCPPHKALALDNRGTVSDFWPDEVAL